MQEIWKDIKGYEGLYQVSDLGRVKSLKRYKKNHTKLQLIEGKIMSIHKQYGKKDNEYLSIVLYKNNIAKNKFIHRLVAEAFLDNYDENLQVNHKDGNKLNNNVENLEMLTRNENVLHAYNVLKRKHIENIVLQFDLQNNLINEYINVCEASRKTNICRTCISDCCNNKLKTAGGYIWKYK